MDALAGPMKAFTRMKAALLGERIELPAELRDRFPELDAARWRRGGLFVRVGGWCLGTSTVAGITLWRNVWLAPGVDLHPHLLLHELRHVHQFGERWLFPLQYVWQSLRHGYRHNRFETDAEHFAHQRVDAVLAQLAPPSSSTSSPLAPWSSTPPPRS
jgi:hypothetical protein